MKTLLATSCLVGLSAASLSPAYARGDGFGAGFVGGVLGGAIGGALVQPREPVYVAPPPVVYERRVYVQPAPIYVAPAQHVVYHPWPGPGFACYDTDPSSVNRAICASADLSGSVLGVQQAMYSAIQQTPYNAGALRGEYAGFLQRLRSACGGYTFQQQVDCISGQIGQQHDAFASRLSGVYADEAARPAAVEVQVQQRLHDVGLLQGSADGIYGDGTRRAIAAWQGGQRHPATGVLTNDEVATLIPGYGAPVTVPVMVVPAMPAPAAPVPAVVVPAAAVAVAPPPAPAAPVVTASATPDPAPAPAATDPLGGLRENMPYALARGKLFAAGWQTQFFSTASLTDQQRDTRQWFIDHHMSEVADCSSSGCKLELHNADGRLLYVYTQPGSHSSDAYSGTGPAVVAFCMDVDDITCPAPTSQQAAK